MAPAPCRCRCTVRLEDVLQTTQRTVLTLKSDISEVGFTRAGALPARPCRFLVDRRVVDARIGQPSLSGVSGLSCARPWRVRSCRGVHPPFAKNSSTWRFARGTDILCKRSRASVNYTLGCFEARDKSGWKNANAHSTAWSRANRRRAQACLLYSLTTPGHASTFDAV